MLRHSSSESRCQPTKKVQRFQPRRGFRRLRPRPLERCGDAGAAVKSVREAIQLERVYPTWLIIVLAAAYRDSGAVDLSIPTAKESVRLDPQTNDARLILCSDYKLTADHDQAQRVAGEIIARDPAFSLAAYAKSQPYKDPASLERLITALRESGLPD